MINLKSPPEFFGFTPGADRTLADWKEMLSYFEYLTENSPRLKLTHMGLSTEGKPFVYLVITSEENQKNLDELRLQHELLADPRKLKEEEVEEHLDTAKTVVMISCGIHATEIGGPQYSMYLAHSLATGSMPNADHILDDVILILVPSLNPDGHQMITDWYRQNLGTEYEGGPMPWLYQKYVGHDNNRDWYTFSQVENRLTVEKIHNVWHPQIIFDMHQMGPNAARFFVPPYVDPIEPNVDPILQQQIIWVGSAMAQELTAQDKKGVLIHGIYDAWNPARSFQHTHGGIRILTEAASCRIATPVEVKYEDLAAGIGYDGKKRAWNFPEPWLGGTWRLWDIMEYERIVTEALLAHAARNRATWMRNFLKIGQKAVNRQGAPYAFVIPAEQRPSDTVHRMLKMMDTAQVELFTADEDFTYGNKTYAKGSYIIPKEQPYFAFAKCLLEKQDYPDIREYPGGPPQRPYDVTAFTQGLLMGVDTVQIDEPLEVKMTRLDDVSPAAKSLLEFAGGYLTVDPKVNDAFSLANKLLKQGFMINRLKEEENIDGQVYPAGLWIIPEQENILPILQAYAEEGMVFTQLKADLAMQEMKPVRFGLYNNLSGGAMDEGWLRYVLEQFDFEFERPTKEDIKKGNLIEQYDAIILPSMMKRMLEDGWPRATAPAPYHGGLGKEGAEALKEFAQAGGTLIVIDQAVNYAIEAFDLPVKNILEPLPPKDFYIPGSLLRAKFDNQDPITWGAEKEEPIWFMRSAALTIDEGKVLAHYPGDDILMSGWIFDPQAQLNGRTALAQIEYGKGKIICFAFNPIYRAQGHNTYKLVFNSILSAGI